MDIEKIRSHWYAYIYDLQENQTDDVALMLSVLGDKPLDVLEVCCGTGRILVPLARAGHNAVGLDRDEDMLARIPKKTAGLTNLRYFMADAITDDWGGGYDAVVLAGNIMINIVTSGDYEQAQRLFVRKAAQALKPGGRVYLCFDLHTHPERVFGRTGERVYFDGTDDRGVYGRYIGCGGTYDEETQMAVGKGRTELTLPNGEKHKFITPSKKHIPTLAQVHGWLRDNGFAVEEEYGDFAKNPISEKTHRAVICAHKG